VFDEFLRVEISRGFSSSSGVASVICSSLLLESVVLFDMTTIVLV
jgi:hypothetical protein